VYEAEEGGGGDEEYGKDWRILSGRKYCPQGCATMKNRMNDRGPTVRPDLGHSGGYSYRLPASNPSNTSVSCSSY